MFDRKSGKEGVAQAERLHELQEAAKKKDEQDKRIQDYHNKIVQQVYEPWSKLDIKDRDSLEDYPNTRNQPTYVWVDLDSVFSDAQMVQDAFIHLSEIDAASKSLISLFVLMKIYDDRVRALVQWQDDIFKEIEDECQLRAVNYVNPQVGEFSTSILMNYFEFHYFSGNAAEVKLFKDKSGSLPWTILLIQYNNGTSYWLAESLDTETDRLTKLQAKLDAWGKHFAKERSDLVVQRQVIESLLQGFRDSLIPVKRRLTLEPHLMTTTCYFEKSFQRGSETI